MDTRSDDWLRTPRIEELTPPRKRDGIEIHVRALMLAAEAFYQSEIVDTGMEFATVGTGQEFASKEDWVKSQMNQWMSEAREEGG